MINEEILTTEVAMISQIVSPEKTHHSAPNTNPWEQNLSYFLALIQEQDASLKVFS